MGPFYEKYIKKMGQMFVKDRVKRLKETFEVARKGNMTSSIVHNSSIFSKKSNERDDSNEFRKDVTINNSVMESLNEE